MVAGCTALRRWKKTGLDGDGTKWDRNGAGRKLNIKTGKGTDEKRYKSGKEILRICSGNKKNKKKRRLHNELMEIKKKLGGTTERNHLENGA